MHRLLARLHECVWEYWVCVCVCLNLKIGGLKRFAATTFGHRTRSETREIAGRDRVRQVPPHRGLCFPFEILKATLLADHFNTIHLHPISKICPQTATIPTPPASTPTFSSAQKSQKRHGIKRVVGCLHPVQQGKAGTISGSVSAPIFPHRLPY
jgi:hypothetical protein